MYFDVVLSVFIHPCTQKRRRAVFARSWRAVCLRALQICVRARKNFSHSARLLLQQSWASYMLALCLRAFLISSPDTWDWTRMHALAVMHRKTLCENVDSAKIKVPFYKYRYFTRGIDASYRHTLYRYIDPYRLIVTPLVNTIFIVCQNDDNALKYYHSISQLLNFLIRATHVVIY